MNWIMPQRRKGTHKKQTHREKRKWTKHVVRGNTREGDTHGKGIYTEERRNTTSENEYKRRRDTSRKGTNTEKRLHKEKGLPREGTIWRRDAHGKETHTKRRLHMEGSTQERDYKGRGLHGEDYTGRGLHGNGSVR